MDAINQLVTDVLEDLVESELKQFTRQLWIGVKPDVDPIPRGKLEKADRQDVVDSMVQHYSEDAGKITVQALRKIKQNERAKRLESNLLKVQPQVQENEPNPEDPQSIPQSINTAGSDELEPIQSDWQRPQGIITRLREIKSRFLYANRDDIYTPVSRNQRKGLALLITNIQFANKRYDRAGAEKDEENMEWLLTTLNFMEISRTVQDFSRRPEHQEADSTFVIIMSHGQRIQNRDAILGVNYNRLQNCNDVYFVEDTFSHLNSVNCPALIDKPKVILIQACRGEQPGGEFVQDCVPESDSWVHKEKDFVCFMSTLPDMVAYRDVVNGSFFISYIVDVFCSSAYKDHIMELFRKVAARMEKDQRFRGHTKLLPCIERTSLVKKFYLFPEQ
ncbi:caspase b-like isoform X2 [Danio aesculapii]|uniref:caspase b-like isoform X2 n=1 Tax=Danio aesculapii TaxID=1142201 RepID=UPI0024C0D896|nr:caspase b-like isoform X2 [Danio aesculapii]